MNNRISHLKILLQIGDPDHFLICTLIRQLLIVWKKTHDSKFSCLFVPFVVKKITSIQGVLVAPAPASVFFDESSETFVLFSAALDEVTS